MTEKPVNTRLYSEKEMGKLIQRATELQQEKSEALHRGLSLDDIEHIAAEIGLDPEHLRTAALELEQGFDARRSIGLWGAPFNIDLKQVVDGELTDEQWGEIVYMLRRITGASGKMEAMGNMREWSHSIDRVLGLTRVSISPRGTQSTVEVHRRYRGWSILFTGLALLLGGTVTGIMLDGSGLPDIWQIVLFLTGCSTAFIAVGAGLKTWAKRQQKKMKLIMNSMVEILSPPLALSNSQESLIDLPEAGKETEEAAMARLGRVKS